MSPFDRLIVEFDHALRVVTNVRTPSRRSPADDVPEADLPPEARDQAQALMRVNHVGEVCAQALYQGQALASKDATLTEALRQAAREEEDHLAWTAERVDELGGRLSLLNPLWYAGSVALGFAAGKLGDRWSLGFLKETEVQVEAHLQSHLDRLSPEDQRTRVVVEQMKSEEAGHAQLADRLGAANLPLPVRGLMRLASKVMTTVSYRV